VFSDLIEPAHLAGNFLPAFLVIRGSQAMHRTAMHHAAVHVRLCEYIRQTLLGREFPSTEDYFR
jgi:hypothetical protein